MPEFDSLDEMVLQVALTKTTGSDPFYEQNWYRILKVRYDGKIYVQRRVSETLTTLISTPYISPTGSLRVTVVGSTIYFYANE
ncbi:hypothetical protein KEJ34_00995 [Candidatus Bathyarchaeota archaeon]|nr:hypothetical protein [Candidatus Bathyarchaeota archaeon]